jgi:hypothetical protein
VTRLLPALLACAALAGRAAAADTVVLEGVKTEWQNLYGAIVYAASGTVRNTGGTPVRAVRVRVELFDKNGRPVAQRDGYNLGAEVLDEKPDAFDKVKPIPPGGTDSLRLWLDKGDIGKPFRTATVTVVEVNEDGGAATLRCAAPGRRHRAPLRRRFPTGSDAAAPSE